MKNFNFLNLFCLTLLLLFFTLAIFDENHQVIYSILFIISAIFQFVVLTKNKKG